MSDPIPPETPAVLSRGIDRLPPVDAAARVLLALLLGTVAVGCLLILRPFASALLWAAILVFTTWPVFEWLCDTARLRRTAAAVLMVGAVAVLIVLPVAIAIPDNAAELDHVRRLAEQALREGLPSAPPAWLGRVPVLGGVLDGLWTYLAADLSVLFDMARPALGTAVELLFALLLTIGGGVVQFLLALFIAFFFYVHGAPIAMRLRAALTRIAGARAERLIAVTGATVRGVVFGLLGTAVGQGILTAIGLAVAGVPRAPLLGAVAGLLSLLPVGAPVVWIPASLWLAANGATEWAIGLGLWGLVAISGSDSVIRPWFIARGAQLPFLLTVLGVLGGALAFGLLGIFLGPVLLGIGYTLTLEWTRTESRPNDQPAIGAEPPGA